MMVEESADRDDQKIIQFPGRLIDQADDEMALKEGGGDGTSGGMSDDWKASVDRQLAQLHNDIRSLLSRGTGLAVAVAALIAGLYLYTNDKFEKINQRLSVIETQQAKSEAILAGKLDVLLERGKGENAK